MEQDEKQKTDISESTRKLIFKRAKRQCECRMGVCSHHKILERCPYVLDSKDWKIYKIFPTETDNINHFIAVCPICYNNIEANAKKLEARS